MTLRLTFASVPPPPHPEGGPRRRRGVRRGLLRVAGPRGRAGGVARRRRADRQEIERAWHNNSFTSAGLTQSVPRPHRRVRVTYNAFVTFNPNALSEAAALDAEYRATGPRSSRTACRS
jgi:hypothetical protein